MGRIDTDGRGKGAHAPSATQKRAQAHKRLAKKRGFAKTKDEGLVFSDGTGNIAKVSAKKGKKVAKQKYKTVRSARTGKKLDGLTSASLIAALMNGNDTPDTSAPLEMAPLLSNMAREANPYHRDLDAGITGMAGSFQTGAAPAGPLGGAYAPKPMGKDQEYIWDWLLRHARSTETEPRETLY